MCIWTLPVTQGKNHTYRAAAAETARFRARGSNSEHARSEFSLPSLLQNRQRSCKTFSTDAGFSVQQQRCVPALALAAAQRRENVYASACCERPVGLAQFVHIRLHINVAFVIVTQDAADRGGTA